MVHGSVVARGEVVAPNGVGLSWGRGFGGNMANEARIGCYWHAESVAPHPKRAFGFFIRSIRPFRVIGVQPVAAGPASFQCRASRSRGERRRTAENGGALRRTTERASIITTSGTAPLRLLRSAPQFSAASTLSLRGSWCSRPRRLSCAMVSRATQLPTERRSGKLNGTPPPQSRVCFFGRRAEPGASHGASSRLVRCLSSIRAPKSVQPDSARQTHAAQESRRTMDAGR